MMEDYNISKGWTYRVLNYPAGASSEHPGQRCLTIGRVWWTALPTMNPAYKDIKHVWINESYPSGRTVPELTLDLSRILEAITKPILIFAEWDLQNKIIDWYPGGPAETKHHAENKARAIKAAEEAVARKRAAEEATKQTLEQAVDKAIDKKIEALKLVKLSTRTVNALRAISEPAEPTHSPSPSPSPSQSAPPDTDRPDQSSSNGTAR